MALVDCADCGNPVSTEAAACPKCGRPARKVDSSEKKLSRTTAGLLALLLGGVGIHRFYLGKPLSGFLYLIFCWTFIPALVGLLEGVRLLCLSDKEFAEQYCGLLPTVTVPTQQIRKIDSRDAGPVETTVWNKKLEKTALVVILIVAAFVAYLIATGWTVKVT